MRARILAAALAASAGIHLAAAVQHGLIGTHGAFFVVAGLAQAGLAVLVGRGVARATLPATVLSGGLVAVWLATRLPGVTSAPEPVGVLDLTATALELVAVAAGLVLLRGDRSAGAAARGSSPLRPLLVLPAVALVAVAASITAPAHGDHHHGGSHPHAEPVAQVSPGPAPPSEPIFGDLFEDHHGAPTAPAAPVESAEPPADHVEPEGSEPPGH